MPGWVLSSAVRGARPRRHRLPHLADDVVVDQIDDLGPERGLGDMRVDIDEEIVLHPLGLDGGVREDVARVRLGRDLLELSDVLYRSLLHQRFSSLERRPGMLDHLPAPVEGVAARNQQVTPPVAPPPGGGRAMRPRLRSAIADLSADTTADLSRWTHRVGVTGRAREAPPPGTPSDLAGRRRVSLLSRTAV